MGRRGRRDHRLAAHARTGPGDAQGAKPGRGDRSARLPNTWPRSSARLSRPATRYTVLRNGDEVFPAMLDAIRQAQSRISFESFIYEDGAGRRPVHHRARRRGQARRHGAHRPRRHRQRALARVARQAHRRRRHAGAGSTRCARGRSRRPTTAPIARCWSSMARWRSPAASAWPTTGSAMPDPGALARHAVQGDGTSGARARGVVLRELARVGRRVGAGARSGATVASHRRALDRGLEQPDGRREQRQAAVPAVDRRRAPADRHPVAVLHPRRIDAVVARRGAASAACASASSPTATSPMRSR